MHIGSTEVTTLRCALFAWVNLYLISGCLVCGFLGVFLFFAVLFCQAPHVTTCQLKDSCVGMGWRFGQNEGNKTKQGVYRRDCSSESHAFSFPSHPSLSRLSLCISDQELGMKKESLGIIVWVFDFFFFFPLKL